MTVLSAQTIANLQLVSPLHPRTEHPEARMSYGLSACGYDVTLDQDVHLSPGQFCLASTAERFRMRNFVVGIVHDKSTLARRGVAVQNTVIEPGWRGYLTLELTNHGPERVSLLRGWPVAQILFHRLDLETEAPYSGKYQNQERGPQGPR